MKQNRYTVHEVRVPAHGGRATVDPSSKTGSIIVRDRSGVGSALLLRLVGTCRATISVTAKREGGKA